MAALAIAATASAQPVQNVSIAVSSASLPGGVARIANEMGLFDKHGLHARTTVMDNSSVASAALISGSVDFTTSAGSEVVVAEARGQQEVAVVRLYSGFSGVVVLGKATADKLGVAPTAPVAERLKALAGLVIASPNPTSSYTLSLRPAAEAAGARLHMTYMAMSGMDAALESGAVQGFVSSSPFYALPVVRGTGVIWINGPKGDFPPEYIPTSVENLNTMRSFADAHPDVILQITAVFEDFAQAVRERPADVKAAIAKLFPDLDGQSLDLLFEIEAPAFQTEHLTLEGMAHEIAFVKRSGARLPELDLLNPAALYLP